MAGLLANARDRQGQSQDRCGEPTVAPSRAHEIGLLRTADRMSRHATFAHLLLGCIIASLLMQCHQAKMLDLESQEGKPCICNSTFYRFCPDARDCLENRIPESVSTTKPPIDPRDKFFFNNEFAHDDLDPDHVSDPWQLPPEIDDLTFDRPIERRPVAGIGGSSGSLSDNIHYSHVRDDFPPKVELDPGARESVHRKVYLKPIDRKSETIIHGINIRIPLKMPVVEEPRIPDPEPRFKMRKYVTYERKPKIVNVPVVKTIIKPVGLRPDQIIPDDSPAAPLAL